MRAIFLSALFLALASRLGAENLRTDAFGLFDEAVDPDRMSWAGVISTIVDQDQDSGEDVIVAPGPNETVLIHFGEKSLAQGSGIALVAAIILDARGNLVADGTSVTLRAEDGAILSQSANGIAARPVPAGERPGIFHAWAETVEAEDRRQSARVTYRVVPALREQAADLVAPATELQTEEAVSFRAELLNQTDRPDLLDGISSQIIMAHPQGGHSVVPGTWIGGQLQARLLTRDISGTARARLHLPYAASPELPVAVNSVTLRGPLLLEAATRSDIRATWLRLGPLMTTKGHLLHDGSLAEISITDAEGRNFESRTWTLDGLAEFTVPSDALPFDLSVETAGGTFSRVVTVAEVQQ